MWCDTLAVNENWIDPEVTFDDVEKNLPHLIHASETWEKLDQCMELGVAASDAISHMYGNVPC